MKCILTLTSLFLAISVFATHAQGQAEQESAWHALLEESSTDAFRGFKQDELPDNWSVRDGVLIASGAGGDIVSREQYVDFELELEYKLEQGGNSGIFFYVKEHESFDKVWRSGIEFQIIDNEHSPLAGKSPKNQAGSVYALYAPSTDATLPSGNWNKVRIRSQGSQVDYWINGEHILRFHLGSPKWYQDREATLHNSQRKPFWGEFRRGHIALQDEGFTVAYRSIKIRHL